MLTLTCALASVVLAATTQSAVFEVSTASSLAAAMRKMPDAGGEIRLAPGVYEIADPLIVKKSNVVITGSGWSTVIRKKGPGDAIVFEGSLWSCWVRDLAIEGDAKAKRGSGIVFRGGEWSGICRVERCHIRQFAESGIWFQGNKNKPFSSNTVADCWFTNNLGHQLHSVYNNDFYFSGNQFGAGADRRPLTGCFLDSSSAGTYDKNYHWGNQVGLRMRSSQFNRIENNRIEQSTTSGVVIGEPDGSAGCYLTIMTGNTIHTNSETNSGKFPAVICHGASDLTFTNNQIFSWDSNSVKASDGLILSSSCKNCIVTGNVFRHYTGKAIVAGSGTGHIIRDNITDEPAPTASVSGN